MSKEIKVTPRTAEELKAELDRLEKEDVKQRVKINADKKKIRDELTYRQSYEGSIRRIEFMKDKTPFWMGIKQGWTMHRLVLVLDEPQTETLRNGEIRAAVNILNIECRLDDKDVETMLGKVGGNLTMSFISSGLEAFCNTSEWTNISELEFKARIKELSEPFFEAINRVTKPLFKLGSNNLLE